MQLLFPHEQLRPSQKELIDSITNALSNKKSIIIHAPTGLGKTASSLAPALSYAIENDLTVFFVTPKHTQHRIAVETLRAIKKKFDIDFQVVDLIGKKHMCAQNVADEMSNNEFYDYCKDLVSKDNCNFYSNLKNKDKLSLQTELVIRDLSGKILHVEEMKDSAKSEKLCPFEVSCILGKKARVIIGDYHHILSSSVRDNLFEKLEKDLSKCIIIMDEAHNLPDKCRDLMSTQLSSSTIEYAVNECLENNSSDFAEVLNEFKLIFENLTKIKFKGTTEALLTKDELNKEINKIINIDQFTKDLLFIGEAVMEVKKKSFCYSIAHFIINWQGPDPGFTRFINKNFNYKNKPVITINYKCLDPSLILNPLSKECYSIIAMSGTLTPLDMYKDLFNINALTGEFKNPFPVENKVNLIIPDTTTKFTARSDEMFNKIAVYCSSIVNNVNGNTIIFFPSYDLRDKVNNFFSNKCEKTTMLETQNLSKQEKSELIDKFKLYRYQGAVLLAASAGSFGEGIDIEDNIIKCVIVVGIPLDKPNLETQELINYYDKKFGKGWDYAYIMPAVIKCFQNAGRCIRSEKDRGIVVFLDQRYIWESYFKCFPRDSNIKVTKEPISIIKNFFS